MATKAKKKPARTKKATAKKKGAKKAAAKTKKKAGSKAKARKATAKAKPAKEGPTCAITKAEFASEAHNLHVEIVSDGKYVGSLELDPRDFSSGSFGWFASEKLQVLVGDERVRCQMSLNVTVIGSKNSD